MKKLLVMLATTFAINAFAETETVDGYTWTYRIIDGGVELNGSYAGAISPKPTGAVAIPSVLGGKPVICIAMWAFSDCSGLTSVIIPDSVTSIEPNAFSRCSSLASVTIPDGMMADGESFGSCVKLWGK